MKNLLYLPQKCNTTAQPGKRLLPPIPAWLYDDLLDLQDVQGISLEILVMESLEGLVADNFDFKNKCFKKSLWDSEVRNKKPRLTRSGQGKKNNIGGHLHD